LAGTVLPAFDSLTRDELSRLLADFATDLETLPARDPAPWALAMAFNDLLAAFKTHHPDDSVAATIVTIAASSPVANGTLLALAGQLRAGLGGD
jgi:hypothetical protein